MSRTIITQKDIEEPQIAKRVTTQLDYMLTEDVGGVQPEAEEVDESTKVISVDKFNKYAAEESLDPKVDNYTSRLLKYIPAEVIALYVTLDAIIRSSENISIWIYWSVFIFGVVATYLYLNRVEKVTKQIQLLISAGAFMVWVFAIGGPFSHLAWYQPIYGGLLLPIYTFLAAIIEA
jgi:hypothetical protein